MYVGAVNVGSKKCEDCGVKQPTYGFKEVTSNSGITLEGKKRWCTGCAKEHAGTEDLTRKKNCEGCQQKMAFFGLPAEGIKRWCRGCAKAHTGAVDIKHKKCEGCGLKEPGFALPPEGKVRWCFGCAPEGAVARQQRRDRGVVRRPKGESRKKPTPKATDPPLTISGP
jgi:hypothetical protein